MNSRIRTRLAAAMGVPVAVLVAIAVFEAAKHAKGASQGHPAALALWSVLALGAMVFGTAAVLRVSHSITAPLVRLSAYADDLAEHRLAAAVRTILADGPTDDLLPTPPAVDGDDEVASVAKAFMAVQQRALALAVEQSALRGDMAEALTNLGRRNQNLLSRQLDYITGIERNETDPDKLDQLFKLDHLATRMRRNAESLLVLGGAESPRQWKAPVAVVDIVRSALAEVEDFRRVTLGSIVPTTVAGRVTSDVAHLLAELIENGLSYSPPHTEVRVDGAERNGVYVLTITDRGLGIDAAGLAQANARLRGDDAFSSSPSKHLGLFVTGQLARRHGISVTLEPGSASGTVATVTLPAALLPELAPAAGDKPVTSPAGALAGRIRPGTPEPGADARGGGRIDQVAAPAAVAVEVPAPPAIAAPAPLAVAAAPAAPAGPGATDGRRRREGRRQPALSAGRPDDLLALLDDEELKARGRRTRRDATPPRHAPGRSPAASGPDVVTGATPAPASPAPAVAAPGLGASAGTAAFTRPLAAPAPAVPHVALPGHDVAALAPTGPLLGGAVPDAAALQPTSRPAAPSAGPVATPAPLAAPAPAAEPPAADNSFESWLDSRLEQLAKMSVEQAVTATPPRPVEPAQVDEPATGEASGLPRRRPGGGGDAASSGLRRRHTNGDAPAPSDVPKVSSSLFRYLSAVDQRTNETPQEGTR